MKVLLNELEAEYQKQLDKIFVGGKPSNIDELIDASVTLFQEIQVKDITGAFFKQKSSDRHFINKLLQKDVLVDKDNLFAGYFSRNKNSLFEFNITRTFIDQNTGEEYNLLMAMLFELTEKPELKIFDVICCSDSTEKWIETIKNDKFYKLAKNLCCNDFGISLVRNWEDKLGWLWSDYGEGPKLVATAGAKTGKARTLSQELKEAYIEEGNSVEAPSGKAVSIDSELFCRLVESVERFVLVSEDVKKIDLSGMTHFSFRSLDESGNSLNLSGILLENSEGLLRMTAIDGHRLAIAEGEAAGIEDLVPSGKILVPQNGILEIYNLAESGQSIELSASENFLFASNGDTEIWVRLLDADFPDYRKVIPKDNQLVATINRDAFAEALCRFIMSSDKKDLVTLSLSRKQLKISSYNPDNEEEAQLEVDYEGPPLKIGFNANYLQDAIACIREENMILQMKDKDTQVILRPENDTSYISIVMPCRLA